MKTKEEIRIDFYGPDDARAYDYDELYIMEQYASQTMSEEYIKFLKWYDYNEHTENWYKGQVNSYLKSLYLKSLIKTKSDKNG